MDRIYYFKELAKVLKNGNMEILVAEHLLRRNEWGASERFLHRGLEKGDISDPEKVRRLEREIHRKLQED